MLLACVCIQTIHVINSERQNSEIVSTFWPYSKYFSEPNWIVCTQIFRISHIFSNSKKILPYPPNLSNCFMCALFSFFFWNRFYMFLSVTLRYVTFCCSLLHTHSHTCFYFFSSSFFHRWLRVRIFMFFNGSSSSSSISSKKVKITWNISQCEQ